MIAAIFRSWAKFTQDTRANVALTFGIATLPVIGMVGAAVDVSYANRVQAAMQSALDSTALMLSRDAPKLTDGALQAKAKAYFEATFTRDDIKKVTITATYSATASQVVVDGVANVPTSIMGIAGYDWMTVKGSSTAKWGSERLRVALALDNTGSMAWAGKMLALKVATKALLTQLQSAANADGDVYVSIVPFNKDVNLGRANYNQTWIDWTEWDYYNGTCSKKDDKVRNQGECLAQGGNATWTPDPHSNWNGCVMDRGNVNAPHPSNYDQTVSAPSLSIAASRYPAENYASCPVAALGLSYDWAAMNRLVDSMVAVGNTNQPIGLVWAWQSLVGGGPFTAPATNPNYTYKDIIILMSDGLNTENRWSTNQSEVDRRMYDPSTGTGTCANAKATGVTIYTIHVNTDGDPMSTLLKNCASGTDKFWMITSAADLGQVFKLIGTNITKLRVAK